jgi:hypothetical protein
LWQFLANAIKTFFVVFGLIVSQKREFMTEYSLLKKLKKPQNGENSPTENISLGYNIGIQIFAKAFSFWRNFAIFRQRNWENRICKKIDFSIINSTNFATT